MGLDERGTLAALKAHLRELIDPKIGEYGGRTVKSMGDGLLLEFPSVVDAVRFAVDVQRGMVDRNARVPEPSRIIFRIGVDVGDIIIDGEDIFGDGVNVAARLQTLAEPGGICVSRVVRDEVIDKLSLTFVALGVREMKNIARPIEVYRIALGSNSAAAATRPLPHPRPIAGETPSIAVLPFVNRSRDEEDEYFSDGLADELLNVLAKIRGLRVAARTSPSQFKGKNEDLAVIGRASSTSPPCSRAACASPGNRVRISVQLVKVSDGYHLWSETYDRTLDDIFAVQDDIAQSVVKELRTTLLGEAVDPKASGEVTAEVAAAVKGRGTDPEAHRLYLQARHFLDRVHPRGHGEGDRVPGGGAGPGSRLRARLGGAWAGVREWKRDAGWVPLAEGLRAGARGGRACARARAGSGGGARADGRGSRWSTTGTGAARRRRLPGRWSWRRAMPWCFAGPASWRRPWVASMRRSRCIAARWSRIR